MEITLEKIELVKDRTGVSYKEAKEALEKNDGNVVDAIIYIEEMEIEGEEAKISDDKTEIIQKIKDLVKKGNVTKIQFRRQGNVILNIPVNIGALGTIIFPIAAVTAAVAALATKCSIEIVKDNGEVVDINELSGGRIETVRDKTEDVILNFGEKAGDALDDLKIKAGDAYENLKYKAAERREMKSEDMDDFECSPENCAACGGDCSEDDDIIIEYEVSAGDIDDIEDLEPAEDPADAPEEDDTEESEK